MCHFFLAKISDQNAFLEQFLAKIQLYLHFCITVTKFLVVWEGACHYDIIDDKHWNVGTIFGIDV